MNKNRVLVLAPHTDDGEFGCGATINKFIEEGKEVYMAAFSACEQSVLKEFPKDILITEVKEATQVLGIRPENLSLYPYQVRTFNFQRQSILDDLIQLRERLNPDLIIMPTMQDVHQDHHTIAEEALRAFKFSSILCYELPWNNISFKSSSFVIVSERNLQKKVDALAKYRSQTHRSYANEELIRSICRMRGVQINSRYAEAFEVIRWIV